MKFYFRNSVSGNVLNFQIQRPWSNFSSTCIKRAIVLRSENTITFEKGYGPDGPAKRGGR